MITANLRPAKNCMENKSAFLKFDYNKDIINVIRAIPGRAWHPDTKEWEIPVSKLGNVERELTNCHFVITDETEVKLHERMIPDGYQFKTKPFSHQIVGVNFGLNHDKWFLGDEMGAGKTWQTLNIAVLKKKIDLVKHCLIICCVNGLKWNWYDEVLKHTNEKPYIIGQHETRNGIRVGDSSAKIKDLERINEIQEYFLIINIESLRNPDICNLLDNYCVKGDIGMAIVDEVHQCRNPESKQTAGLLRLQPKYRIALSGTPLVNNVTDLYVVFSWLGQWSGSYYSFENSFCKIAKPFGYRQVVGFKNLDALESKLNTFMLRRKKEDILDLPEKVYINEFVEMSDKQKAIYKEALDNVRKNIDEVKKAINPLSKLIRIRQATGYTGILSSKVKESCKFERAKQLIEESSQNNNKVVVFSNWTEILTHFNVYIKEYKPLSITGDDSVDKRREQEALFQNDPERKVICGTIKAMGTGLNLTAGNVVIFLDEPWTMTDFSQCTDRCHRIGTTKTVVVYVLMCKGTIDERVHNIVQTKGELSEQIVDNMGYEERSKLINYLLEE